MKNTFKYIAAFVAFSAAALASGLTVSAQNLPDGTYKEENGIAYAKRAIVNDDGTYTIDIETFVTGEVTQTYESVPADVVLVLDVSGSMTDGINTYTYNTATRTNLRARDFNWGYGYYDSVNENQTNYYYKYNDNYYRVYVGRARNGGYSQTYHYFLFFTVGGTRYHINSSGQVVTSEPTNVTSDGTNLWSTNLTLYTRTATPTGVSKLQALKSAVEAFIVEINNNDRIDPETNQERDERLGNRIAIVAFSGAQYAGQSTHNNSIQLNTGWVELGEDKDIDDATGFDSLIEDVGGLSASGGTHVEYGMQDALALIQNSSADVRTVVLFTDGIPGTGTWGVTETTNSANGAIDYSRQINAITIGSGENATTPKIYAVGLFDEKPTDGTDTYKYMNYVCSNYPAATGMSYTGTKDSDNFYMDASGGSAEELKEIFTSIAHSAGGSGNTQVSGGSSLTVDVVSSSFSVPQGFEENPQNAVTVLVAPCTGQTTVGDKTYLTFGTAKAPGEYSLPAITPSISESDNKVSTTGFDYSANWCGPDPTSTSPIQPGYHGFKQIIRFIITVNDDAVGGPAVETNDPNSGIYLEGATEPLIKFNRPTVKLPVQIWIQKAGLQGEDSAVFTLARTPFVENFNPETAKWESITKIVVGPDDLDPNTGLYLKKQVGLDPDYYYRIKEDAWAFGYTYQLDGVQYTVGDNVKNPFEFENVPKEKKFDEASVRNIFNEKTSASGGGE